MLCGSSLDRTLGILDVLFIFSCALGPRFFVSPPHACRSGCMRAVSFFEAWSVM